MINLIVHNDLDGIAAAAVFYSFHKDKKNTKLFVSNHGTQYEEGVYQIDELTNDLVDKEEKEVIIFDICPSEKTIARINRLGKEYSYKVFDHHVTNKLIAQKFPEIVVVNESICGTQLAAELCGCSENEIIKAVAAWDMWKLDSPYRPLGERLQNLYEFYGKKFISILCKMFLCSECEIEKVIPYVSEIEDILEEKKQAHIHKIIKKVITKTDKDGNNFLFVVDCKFVSEVAKQLRQKNVSEKYLMMMNLDDYKTELRSLEDGFDVSVIAKNNGGGGHKAAAGYPLTMDDICNKLLNR